MRPSLDPNTIEILFKKIINDNKSELKRELVTKIDPNMNTYFNSLNVLVGRPGSGKSYTAIHEMIHISHQCPRTHLLVYVAKSKKPDILMEKLDVLFNVDVEYVLE
jgi:hypothetical protein